MIWTAALFALAVLTLVALLIFLANYEVPKPPTEEKPLPETLAGEDVYRGNPIAYPVVMQNNISRITVSNNNKDGAYTLYRSSDINDNFIFSYEEDGEVKIYYPSIYGATGIDYTDFYAVETNDGYNTIARIDYLLASLQTPYFGERIPLSSDSAERARQLEIYGFGGESETVVSFDYTDTNTGSQGTHRIVIGDRTINGKGYYFTVDDRDYVYSSQSSYFEYAMLGFYSYVNTALVAEGLAADSTYEPLLTPEFTHYKNTMHTIEEGKAAPTVVRNSTLVMSASTLTPTTPDEYLSNPYRYGEGFLGYEDREFENMTVDLYTEVDSNKVLTSLTDGRYTLGVLDSPLVYTLPVSFNSSKEIDFAKGDVVRYDYKIVEIEAVVTDKEDITALGTDVSATDKIRVAYYATADGVDVTPILAHAYLDLTAEALPDGVAEMIAEKNVGKLDTPLTFTVNYTKDNAIVTHYETAIVEIVAITDKDGNAMQTVTEDTKTVMYRYALFIDGEKSSTEHLTEIDFEKHTTELAVAAKNKLIGKSVGTGHKIVTDEGLAYGEAMQHFTVYTIRELCYYTTRREIVSFAFINDSDRDPFYGESIYKNNTDGFELYGLNNNYCEQVLKLLGGLGSNSNASVGLKAESIVSVGITPEKLETYGCYAHTVVFTLPRGIETYTTVADDDEAPLHYIAAEELTFELFVSDVKENGKRIVASSLFDIIAEVSDEYFFFVDETFESFWARDNVLMLSVDNVIELKLDIMMDDVYGSYKMSVVHDEAYRIEDGYQIGGTPPENYYDVFDYITVNVATMGDCTESELTRMLATANKSYVSLEDLYSYTIKDEEKLNSYYPDSYGTTYFKEFMLGLFYIDQEGFVDDAKQADILKEENLLMRLAIKIDSDRDGDIAEEDQYYTYEFYHFPDANKVLIRLYLADSDGNVVEKIDSNGNKVNSEVSDFYISRLAFKRIVSTYVSLINGREFVLGEDYPTLG